MMPVMQSRISAFIVFFYIACVTNAFGPMLSKQQLKLSRYNDMAIMSDKSGENSDALSRRRKRRGKDDGTSSATPDVSNTLSIVNIFVILRSNFNISF